MRRMGNVLNHSTCALMSKGDSRFCPVGLAIPRGVKISYCKSFASGPFSLTEKTNQFQVLRRSLLRASLYTNKWGAGACTSDEDFRIM